MESWEIIEDKEVWEIEENGRNGKIKNYPLRQESKKKQGRILVKEDKRELKHKGE